MTTKQLDTKGLMCPLPVLKARRAMKDMAPGDVLEVEATDPGSIQDFEHFCAATGYRLLDSSAIDGIFSYRIEKTA
jgi:tRNA 2-thiouridine synthesizing protein A